MDTFSREFRSALMARIRGKGNLSTELRLITIFRAAGIKGWRRHSSLIGRPDFTFPKQRTTIFVDGCFWHGCPRCQKIAKSNLDYWLPKISRNQQRDRQVSRKLRAMGWSVIRIWECQLTEPTRVIARVQSKLRAREAKG